MESGRSVYIHGTWPGLRCSVKFCDRFVIWATITGFLTFSSNLGIGLKTSSLVWKEALEHAAKYVAHDTSLVGSRCSLPMRI